MHHEAHSSSLATFSICICNVDLSLGENMLGWSAVQAEAISNAARHARPTIISVSLRRSPPNLVLKIRGNGSGITKDRGTHLVI